MCKIDDYINNVILYIKKTLDYKMEITDIEKKQLANIPLVMSANYKFFNSHLFNTPVVLAFCKNSRDITPVQLQKQVKMIEQKIQLTVIILLDQIASYNLQRLIGQRVNFIIPMKQMFLPSLLMDLKKTKSEDEDIPTQITPIAQCILLYHLQIASLNDVDLKRLMKIFNISYSTANRAVRWLSAQKLISSNGTREKSICIEMGKKALWEKAQPWFTNPIEKKVRTDASLLKAMESGVNALSTYSLINKESHEHYAMSKEEYKNLNIETSQNYGENCIEIWRYNPRLLSKSEDVDRLSLYLSLKDNEDERIQIELEKIINEIRW